MSVDVRGLKITIGGKPIVSDADMTIADGERVGLIGSSGSGKSMIAKAMLGLLPLTAVTNGSIDMGGTEIIGASERALADLRGRYVGAVFQNPAASLNPVMTVAQQIALPLRLHYDLTKAERADRVDALLSKVGLDLDMAGKYPHELSGGQQQRVGIATALITSPRFIIADEPTTALDSITQRQIVDLLTSLVDDAGASMLFITHDFSVLARATTRCYVLDAGRITDSQGRTVDFKNTIIILTSNLGSSAILEGIDENGNITEAARKQVEGMLKTQFRPEFLNRLDEIVFYKPLTRNEIDKIVDLQVADLNRRLSDKQLTMRLTPAARSYIVAQGYDPIYGARPLKRFMQRSVETLIARKLIAEDVQPRTDLLVDYDGDKLVIDAEPECTVS